MKEIKFALKHTFPIFFTYLFIGIAFGILMVEAGYHPFLSIISAIFIYAGSLQIVMVSLLQAHVPLLTIAIMSFFINARHIFYGVAFIEKFRKMGWKYPYMVLSLTDETYSILCSLEYEKGVNEKKADFYIAFFNHFYWILGCTLGSYLGNFFPIDMKGIDFSASAFFLYIVINQWKSSKSKLPALTGLITSLIFYILLGPDRFLIPALSVTVIFLNFLKERIDLN